MNEQAESPYVSFTDLLVGLLFIFMLLVATLAMNVRPLVNPASAEDKISQLTNGLGDRLRDAGVAVKVDPQNGRLLLGADVLFDVGSVDLSAQGIAAITVLARELRRILPAHVGKLAPLDDTPRPLVPLLIDTILIEGHADASPFRGIAGRYRDNTELSAARARAVAVKMFEIEPDLSTALSGHQRQNAQPEKLFGIAGYGEGRPLAGHPALNDPAHRRVEIRIITAPLPR